MFYVYLQTWLNRKDCDKPSVSQKNLSPRSWPTSQFECGMIKRQASEKLSTSIDLLLVMHARTHTHTLISHINYSFSKTLPTVSTKLQGLFFFLSCLLFYFLGSCDNLLGCLHKPRDHNGDRCEIYRCRDHLDDPLQISVQELKCGTSNSSNPPPPFPFSTELDIGHSKDDIFPPRLGDFNSCWTLSSN